jgi:hypothetical protein
MVPGWVWRVIRIPQAHLTAEQVDTEAEFFSYRTNDLTQTAMGLSRDDYVKFSKIYEDLKIFKADPFAVLDQEGVGKLVEMGVKLGRQTWSERKCQLGASDSPQKPLKGFRRVAKSQMRPMLRSAQVEGSGIAVPLSEMVSTAVPVDPLVCPPMLVPIAMAPAKNCCFGMVVYTP